MGKEAKSGKGRDLKGIWRSRRDKMVQRGKGKGSWKGETLKR